MRRVFPATQAIREIGVTEQTYDRQRKEYSGLILEQAKRMKDLEKCAVEAGRRGARTYRKAD